MFKINSKSFLDRFLKKNLTGHVPAGTTSDVYVNVIVFSDPACAEDRGRVIKLAIESVGGFLPDSSSSIAESLSSTIDSSGSIPDHPLENVFDTTRHLVVTPSRWIFYETVGLTESPTHLLPRLALGNLHRFTSILAGGVNLLIYVVTDKPSVKNYKLFYQYLCQEDAPIILVRTHPVSPQPGSEYQFMHTLYLDSDIGFKANLHVALNKYNQQPKVIVPIDRFEQTAAKSWNLLEKEAQWDTKQCRDALATTLIEDGLFSKDSAFTKQNEITDYIEKHYFHNVIVFGETGSGKTSVVEMLLDGKQIRDGGAPESVVPSTNRSKSYNTEINHRHYLIHDTMGLDNVQDPLEAMRELYRLLCKIEGGVSLLVYVHRDHLRENKIKHYKLFQQGVCAGEVPTVLVQTGLEDENIDEWWRLNETEFKSRGIKTEHHACLTAKKGRYDETLGRCVYQDQYDKGAKGLKDMIYKATLSVPWKASGTPLYRALLKILPESEAKEVAIALEGRPSPRSKRT